MSCGTQVEFRRLKSPVVVDAICALGMRESEEPDQAQVVWWDGLPPPEEFLTHKPTQRMNKIPNMDMLCYKSTLFVALNQMRILYPSHYQFFPRTLMLPHQFNEFQREHMRMRCKCENLTWILKPQSGCCGAGIRLIQNPMDIAYDTTSAVIQQYIDPYLLNGFKFDFRFYLLITDLQPLTVFMFKEGIARFCTKKYRRPTRANLKEKFCHITNTAINVENKSSENANFTKPASEVLAQLKIPDLWQRIKNISMLTISAIYPQMVAAVAQVQQKNGGGIDPMHRFFHIIGIDILITESGEPFVLELNDRPSMKVTFPFERGLKKALVMDALKLVSLDGGTAPETPGSGWEKIAPVDERNGLTKVMRTMKQRSLNVLGPRRSMPNLVAASKSIVYPKPVPDKTKVMMRCYRSFYHQ